MLSIKSLGKEVFQINGIGDIEKFFDQIENTDKFLIYSIEATNGNIMTFGVAGEVGFLNFIPSSLQPPYYSSIDNQITGSEIIHFQTGEFTEIPRRNCLPIHHLILELQNFISTGERSGQIEWEED